MADESKESSPLELARQADAIANMLLSMPQTARGDQLVSLRAMDPLLYSLVKAKLDELRRLAGP